MLEVEQKYRAADGHSQSALKALLAGPRAFGREYGEKDAFRLGSLLDCMLTTPDSFDEYFYVMSEKRPSSDMMKAYVQALIEGKTETEAYQASGYKTSEINVKKKYLDEGKKYHEAVIAAGDKTVVSFEEMTQANEMASSVLTREHTAKYFENPVEGTEILYQMDIYWEAMGEKLKSLLDVVFVNHINKIIKPIDVKSTGFSVYSFGSSFKKFGYYIQAAFYTAALKWYIDNVKTEWSNYTIEPFRFIVVESEGSNPPLIWKCSESDLKFGEVGGVDKFGIEVKGWQNLLSELNFHQKNNIWDYKKEVYDSGGELVLNYFE